VDQQTNKVQDSDKLEDSCPRDNEHCEKQRRREDVEKGEKILFEGKKDYALREDLLLVFVELRGT
jgi:hypothetical protein